MGQPEIRPTMMRPAQPRSSTSTVVGLLLVLPALIALVVSYVWPLIWTVRTSFQRVNILRLGDSRSAGTDNYREIFERDFGTSVGLALSLTVVPLLVVLVAAPLIAWAAHKGGTVARTVTRGVLALPLACFAPSAIAAAWAFRASEERVRDGEALLRTASWLGTFGLVAALAVTVYLSALRRRDPLRSPVPAMLVAGGVLTVATTAVALQAFTYPIFSLSIGTTDTLSPMVAMYRYGFAMFQFGPAAAISTLLMAALLVFGLAVTLLLVLTRTRLEVDPAPQSADDVSTAPATRTVALVVGGLALLVVLIVTIVGLAPWLGGLFDGYDETGARPIDAGRTLLNTWLPPLITSIVGVGVAAAAAYGIGALRPLGRWSEWLLLPFGLFLFVGLAPLALRAFAGARTADRLDSFLGLIPPTWLAIPALFVLTLLFRGQVERYELHRQVGGLPSYIGTVVLPALPMVGIVFLATWLVQAQDLLWPLISGSNRRLTGSVEVFRSFVSGRGGEDQAPYHLVLGLPVLLLLLVAAAGAQVLYLNRVALRVGAPEYDGGPRT